MRKLKKSVLVGFRRICRTRTKRVILEHYFGSGLLVLRKRPTRRKLAPPDCARLALNAVSKIAAVRDTKVIALMFRFIIADAVLQRCYNNR